jgi:hypothetical protein
MEISWTRVAPFKSGRPNWPVLGCIGAFLLMLALFNIINIILPTSDDVYLYFNYARRTLGGELPFLDFRVEYPPFAMVFFMIPALVCYVFGGLDREVYAWLFHTQCFMLEAGTLWLSYKLLRKIYPLARPAIFTPRLIWYTLGGLAISLYLLQRFDIAATFLLTLGFYWVYNRKPELAGVALGLGAATKLYPAIALPLIVLYFWRYRRDREFALRSVFGFALAGIVTCLPFLVLNPGGFLGFLKFHSERGIEIESTFATLIALGHYLNLAPAISVIDHNSLGITSQWSSGLATLSSLITVGGLLGLIWLAWHITSPDNHLRVDWLIQATAIGVLWFILANKVLSPQYLIWMLSFVPFWKGQKQPLFLAALVLSFIPFPFLIDWLFLVDWLGMSLLAIRNLLLVIIFIQLIPALELPRLRVLKTSRLAQPA